MSYKPQHQQNASNQNGTSLMQLMLDYSFESEHDPGNQVLRGGKALKHDLNELGLKLHNLEIAHINKIIQEHGEGSTPALTYSQVVQHLLDADFVLQQKVQLRQKKQKQEEQRLAVKQKRGALDKNYEKVNALLQRLEDRAKKLILHPPHTLPRDELDIIFDVEPKLREVLQQKRARLLDAYKEMDLEGKGHIGKTDLGKGLRRLGVAISRGELDLLFDMLDFDSSHSVEYSEFSRIMTAANIQRQEEKLGRKRRLVAENEKSAKEPDPPSDVETKLAEPPVPVKTQHPDIIEAPVVAHPAPRFDAGSTSSGPHIEFLVSDRVFSVDLMQLKQYPDSVLGQIAASAQKHQVERVFLDLNPEVFEFLLSHYFGGPNVAKYIMGVRPEVNVYTVTAMTNTLGLPPKWDIQEESKVNTQSNDCTRCSNIASEQGVHEPGKHRFKVPITKLISSEGLGVDIQVRKNETIIIESVTGSGKLFMSLFPQCEQVFNDQACKEFVVYDSNAYFHLDDLSKPVEIKKVYPGNALYRFNVTQQPNQAPGPTTLGITFQIVTKFSCACPNE